MQEELFRERLKQAWGPDVNPLMCVAPNVGYLAYHHDRYATALWDPGETNSFAVQTLNSAERFNLGKYGVKIGAVVVGELHDGETPTFTLRLPV